MKFIFQFFNEIFKSKIQWNYSFNIYTTLLYSAVDGENIEVIKILLANPKLDVNAPTIFNVFLFEIKFKIDYFNCIQNWFILI